MATQPSPRLTFQFPQLSQQTLALMQKLTETRTAVTFDEVTLEDQPSDFHPTDVSLRTWVTRNVSLKGCGIMSAAMDTVTEARMALEIAKNGGMGVLHRNLSAKEQAAQINWVRRKLHSGGMIDKPITFLPEDRFSKIQAAVAKHEWHFTSFPIVDKDGHLQGLITRDEMDFVENGNPTLKELMKPREQVITAPEGTNTESAYNIMKKSRVKKLPIINSAGVLTGMYVWNDVKGDQHKRQSFSLDDEGHFLVAAAVGFGEEEMARVDLLVESGCKILVLDSSHGACKPAKDQIERIRRKYQHRVEIIVGNIASYDSAIYLLQGAYLPDALKVGIGPGSICTTRQVTGHGVPQLTAIYNVWRAVRDSGAETGYYVPVIADGGVRTSGDIVKCLGFGASGIMLGSVLAGCEESPGTLVVKDGKRFKTIRGMGSRSAMEERSGSRIRYLRTNDPETTKSDELTNQQKIKMVPEGIEGLVEYKGSVERVMNELLGGIQSGLAHTGANTISAFQAKMKPWQQSAAGVVEGNPHNVQNITY